ncbi:MAG: toll/interleukin-1 receptor domain-containing protein [Chitinophagales bacterium]|nr:toll/interleukin-1 receptor domain-containing protein [Chitinophagales bacterium]
MSSASKAFIMYAREDQEMLRALINQLTPLRKSGKLSIWHDERILPGDKWDTEIRKNLNEADIIVLLVSSDFLSSEYIDQVEFKLALERHRQGKAIMVPVIARPCLWEEEATIVSLQALPREGKPISTWHNRDEALFDTVKGVSQLLADIHIKATERRQSIEAVEKALSLYDEGKHRDAYELLVKHAKEEHGVNPRGFHILGRIYNLNEANVPTNLEEAIRLYKIAGALGYKYSYNNIGMIYRDKQMFTQAHEWAQRGAEMEDAHALNLLGIMYNLGEGVNLNKVLAKQYFENAIRYENMYAMYNLARIYLDEQNYKECFALFERAASMGHMGAQYELAELYRNGIPPNMNQAIVWYGKAANQGSIEADFKLGEIFFEGINGVTKDMVAAEIHYGKAAQKGHSDAQLMLGYLYSNIKKDVKSAMRWYEAAAAQNNRVAEFNMGVIFENGENGKPDQALALEWYKKSAAHGYPEAINRLKKLNISGY